MSDHPSLFRCTGAPGGLWLQELGSGNTDVDLPDFQSVCFHSSTVPPRKQGIPLTSKVGGLILFSCVPSGFPSTLSSRNEDVNMSITSELKARE